MTNDIVLAWMKKEGVPLTRQNYLDLAYMGSPPDEIGGEIEASIPREIGEAKTCVDGRTWCGVEAGC